MKPRTQDDLMSIPTPEDVPITGDSAFVAGQINDGVDLTGLTLPQTPKNEVQIWDEEMPLNIKDHPQLSEYVFKWLYPKGRERSSMEGYQYVSGDMARAVRLCGIIPALIGGDDSDEMIRSGDLILGWIPVQLAEARKIYFAKKSFSARVAAEEQAESADQMKRGKHGRYIEQYGEVSTYTGPLQE